MVDIHLQKLLWVYWPGGLKGNDRADRLAGKATLTIGLLSRKICSVEELETLPAGTKPRT